MVIVPKAMALWREGPVPGGTIHATHRTGLTYDGRTLAMTSGEAPFMPAEVDLKTVRPTRSS
jgi:hypothetical protein